MKTQRSIEILLAFLLIASLAACVRPIPGTKEEPVATSEEAAPPAGPTDVLEQIYLFATQTAMATQGITTGVPSALETSVTSSGAQVTPGTVEIPPPAAVEPPQPALPSPQPILAPSPTPGIPASYTLQTGEFPYCIARRFNVNPGELLRINGLTSYSVYYAGMDLRIPQSGGGFPGSRALRPHPGSYTVRPGDSLYTIACAFGDVDPAMIAFVNNMNANAKPDPGSTINIP